MLTHADTLARLLLPAVESLVPGEALDREKRTEYALTREGKVNPAALLLSGALVVAGVKDDTLYSTASTTVYTTNATIHVDLPDGTWNVMALGMLRATNSSTSSLDVQLTMAGIENDPPVTRIAVATGGSPFYDLMTQTNVAGNQTITTTMQFKSDSVGTSAVSDSVLVVVAWRQ